LLLRRDYDWQAGDHADWLEVDLRLVGKVRIKRHRGCMGPHLADLDGVPIGAGAHRSDRASGATGSGDVLNDKLLAQSAREMLADDAGNDVGRPTRSEWNDQCDGAGRIDLCPRDPRYGRKSDGARSQM